MMGGMGFLMVLGALAFLAVPFALIAGAAALLMPLVGSRSGYPQGQPGTARVIEPTQTAGGRVCPSCGQVPAADWNHCAHCGASLAPR